MTEQWVLNASPLIVLCHIEHEHLLQMADKIVVPSAVVSEINAGPEEDKARYLLATGKLPIVDAGAIPAEFLAWDLGSGETAVLANQGWTAILDDGAARRCARSLSVPVKGTLGVVLMARQRNLIPSASAVLHRLHQNGFRLDERVITEALQRTVGEEWK